MAANEGGPALIKNQEEFESNCNSIAHHHHHHHHHHTDNNSKRGISIAERRAAKNGFNHAALSPPATKTSPPYFTVSPGLSPSALLDSPIMLPNFQAQLLSPTTGTFQYPSPNHDNFKLKLKLASNGESANQMETFSEPNNLIMAAQNKLLTYDGGGGGGGGGGEEYQEYDPIRGKESSNEMMMMLEIEGEKLGENYRNGGSHHHHHHHQIKSNSNGLMMVQKNSNNSEDGFYWRKYGQKQVKGSEYPRSYYKCTNTNCQVTKKVERSHDGYVAEIVYKGKHNHPQPNNTSSCSPPSSSSSSFLINDDDSNLFSAEDGASPPETLSFHAHGDGGPGGGGEDHHHHHNIIATTTTAECEAKKRKRSESDHQPNRPGREPKLVVQIVSDIDILEDGYRWRKYGQKVVKGNPNPRSYYKCTTPGCPVRKHVERAADDKKSVITTYEGKHKHQVPSTTKNSSSSSSLVVPDQLTAKPAPAAKQQQQLQPSLYLDRKPPLLNYNHHLNNLNFGPSSLYPLPFPPFHSLPYAYPHSLPSSSKYFPDYMAMPSSHISSAPTGSSNIHHVPPPPAAAAATFHYTTTSSGSFNHHHHHQVHPLRPVLIPKEEQEEEEEDELYDTCLSMPNQDNGTI